MINGVAVLLQVFPPLVPPVSTLSVSKSVDKSDVFVVFLWGVHFWLPIVVITLVTIFCHILARNGLRLRLRRVGVAMKDDEDSSLIKSLDELLGAAAATWSWDLKGLERTR